jgi:hypothetical protein
MTISTKFGSRWYEFPNHSQVQDAYVLWGDGWEDEEGDQEAFENEMTARGIDWIFDESALVDSYVDEALEESELGQHCRYIESQFEGLAQSEDYPMMLQVRDSEGGQTNWLNITPRQAQKIKQILRDE